jgi:hypothetical protein
MDMKEFKDFGTLTNGTAAPLIARKKNEEAYVVSQVVWLKVRETDPEILFYKTYLN